MKLLGPFVLASTVSALESSRSSGKIDLVAELESLGIDEVLPSIGLCA